MTRIESFENKDNYFENKVKITRESQSTVSLKLKLPEKSHSNMRTKSQK